MPEEDYINANFIDVSATLYLTLFKPGFFWLSTTGGGGGFHPPPENNVTVELGQ